MTGSDRERDVRALAEIIADGVVAYFKALPLTASDDVEAWADEHEIAKGGQALWSARAILASDWLAEHDKAVAATALRDAADDLGPLVDAQHPDALNPDQWLRDRADREPCRWANETGDE